MMLPKGGGTETYFLGGGRRRGRRKGVKGHLDPFGELIWFVGYLASLLSMWSSCFFYLGGFRRPRFSPAPPGEGGICGRAGH